MARGGTTRIAAAMLGALALAGCGWGSSSSPGPTAGAAPCPRIVILAEGADLTRFRAGAPRDLTAMAFDARIAGFEARCDFANRDRTALDVRVTPRFEAERGPAAQGNSADLPWFIAVTTADDTEVLGRVADTTRVIFPANVQRGGAIGRSAGVVIPLAEGRRAGDVLVRLSFQLTPEELAQNRQRGPR
jgi:hypothetical protein